MARPGKDKLTLALTLTLLTAAVMLFYLLAQDASRAGDSTPLYSIRRHDPYGIAALHDLLVETGVKVRNLERPRLESTDHGTLVQVLPMPSESFWHEEPQVQATALLQWISEGNTVIQFTRSRTELMDLAGVPGEPLSQTVVLSPPQFGPTTAPAHPTTAPHQPTTAPAVRGKRIFVRQPTTKPTDHDKALLLVALRAVEKHERAGRDPAESPGMQFVGTWNDPDAPASSSSSTIRHMALHAPWMLPLSGPAEWKPIVIAGQTGVRGTSENILTPLGAGPGTTIHSGDDDRVLVGAMTIGRGRLIVVTSPSPAINSGITSLDNLACVLSMIGPGPVIFDEWSHGLGHSGTVVRFLREAGLMPMVFQIVLVLLLYSWSTRGHDRHDAPTAPRRRSVAEQVQTLGHLYAGTLPIDTVHAQVCDAVQRRLCAELRCTPTDLSNRLSQLKPELQKTALEIRAALMAAEHSGYPKCANCDYDLTSNRSDKCPECGTSIPLVMQERIAASQPSNLFQAWRWNGTAKAPASGATVKPARRARAEAQLALALTLSSEFVKEISRDRRSAGGATGNV